MVAGNSLAKNAPRSIYMTTPMNQFGPTLSRINMEKLPPDLEYFSQNDKCIFYTNPTTHDVEWWGFVLPFKAF
jgi:hypothetical protein